MEIQRSRHTRDKAGEILDLLMICIEGGLQRGLEGGGETREMNSQFSDRRTGSYNKDGEA